MDRREQVIELSARISALRLEIAGLEQKRAELAAAEAKLDSFLQPQLSLPQIQEEVTASGANLTARLLSALANTPAEGLTAEQIAERAGGGNIDSIRSGLARLASEGRIERISRGSYRGRELRAM